MINSATHYSKDRTCTPEEKPSFRGEGSRDRGTVRAISETLSQSKIMELGGCRVGGGKINYGGFLEPPWTLNGPGGGWAKENLRLVDPANLVVSSG